MAGRARSHARRGSTLVESAVVAVVFLLLLTGTMELGRLGFAYNEVSFAAQSAARYASVRGSSSGHAATAAEIQSVAETYTGALDNTQVTVYPTWSSPSKNPGSTVQVKVTYNFSTILVPLSPAGVLTVQTTASSIITQ